MPWQLVDLSISSDSSYNFRKNYIYLNENAKQQNLPLRPYTIAGILPIELNSWKQVYKAPLDSGIHILAKGAHKIGITFGGDRYEGDIATMLPSTRLDFIYAQGLNHSNPSIQIEDFKKTRFFNGQEIKFDAVDATHFSFNPEEFYSEVNVPKSCSNLSKCLHPVYWKVLSHILNCESKAENCNMDTFSQYNHFSKNLNEVKKIDITDLKNISGFNLEISSAFGSEESAGKPKWSFEPIGNPLGNFSPGEFENYSYIDRAVKTRPTQVKHLGMSSNQQPNLVRYHFTGNIVPLKNSLDKGYSVQFQVELPGLKPRRVNALIEPGYSTFVELALQK